MLPRPPHWASSRPPGFRLRCSAANSASWSGIQWKVALEKMTSTGSGSASCARSWQETIARSPSASRAWATIDGAASTA